MLRAADDEEAGGGDDFVKRVFGSGDVGAEDVAVAANYRGNVHMSPFRNLPVWQLDRTNFGNFAKRPWSIDAVGKTVKSKNARRMRTAFIERVSFDRLVLSSPR